MKVEVNPQDTVRGVAFELWMSSPMPMVTLTKTFDVSRVVKVAKRMGVGFNAILCWCIGKAASQLEEFYLLPEQGCLFRYDCLAINVIVKNRKGGINSCDIPLEGDGIFVLKINNKKSDVCLNGADIVFFVVFFLNLFRFCVYALEKRNNKIIEYVWLISSI